jgi:hypothetical protein
VTHSINGKPVPQCGDECSCPSLATGRGPLATELQMYSNLVDAVKLIERMIERAKYNCTVEEAELIWRLRFVTRIEPQ